MAKETLGQPLPFPKTQAEMSYYQRHYIWDPKTKRWYKPAEKKKEKKEKVEKDKYYQKLPPDLKEVVDLFEETLSSQDKRRIEAFSKALELAEKEATPYWREQVRVVKDELKRTLGTLEADLAAREKEIKERIKRIKDDLKYEKQYLTLEQQADLARQKREYEQELQNIREKMAASGLASSSIRSLAEERLETEYKDIVESIERRYGRALRSEELQAKRTIEDYLRNLEELRRRTEEKKIGTIRKVERYLGTEELEKIPGLGTYLLGQTEPLYGEMKREKTLDIWQRATGIMGLLGPSI